MRWIVAIATVLSLFAATPAHADYHAGSQLRVPHAMMTHAQATYVVPRTIAIAPPARTVVDTERVRAPQVATVERIAPRSRGPPRG